jgi:hypothetical protein
MSDSWYLKLFVNWKTLGGLNPGRRTTCKLCRAHGKSCLKLKIFLKLSDKSKRPDPKGHVTIYCHIHMEINYILSIAFLVGLVWSHDPKSYAGGSVCYW